MMEAACVICLALILFHSWANELQSAALLSEQRRCKIITENLQESSSFASLCGFRGNGSHPCPGFVDWSECGNFWYWVTGGAADGGGRAPPGLYLLLQLFYLKIYLFKYFVCMSVWACLCVSVTCMQGPSRPGKPLDLELEPVVSCWELTSGHLHE